MRIRRGEFDQIRCIVAESDADEPLTAKEILALLEANGEEFDSAHRVATVLGREAQRDAGVEVVRDQPYRYRFTNC
ncbi:hypothetical protein [Halosegnis rubeus]|uniref:Uncharacterized protein n=1 Tax=Halosegnis rubeus TaxID=2212850 RepID=A0A5N5ULE3_9EURY|nr:hypothetical protein [Halosegnis rubeus]KAB7518432.1 hypothetical protein DMP03_03480 [Halosegnis rubeus]